MKSVLLLGLIASSALASPFKIVSQSVGSSLIPFVHNAEIEENLFNKKASFATIEKMAPLDPQKLATIQPEDLRALSMEDFDQIYARISSGPMPLGNYTGSILQKPPIYDAIKKRLHSQVIGLSEFAKLAEKVCGNAVDDCLIEFIWKGKYFWPKNDLGQVMAKTVINPGSTNRALKFFDLEDTADKLNSVFPMNAYCGISQVDTRRESIIADASFGDGFGLPAYVGIRDQVVTRKGLNILEEYRMVRPGLYIGKVYSNKMFLFNVALEKIGTPVSSDAPNACLDTIKQ